MPAVGLLLLAPALALRGEFATRWRALAAGAGGFVVVALLPLLFVSTMNLRTTAGSAPSSFAPRNSTRPTAR
ncbi:MAG: hypothetical protein WDM96_02665 [Lacunisphaera sp.]